MRHFERLHLLGARVRGGMSPQDAMKTLRPPVHFKAHPRVLKQQQYWSERRCASALALLLEAERQCKRTGFPDRTLCSDVLLRLARSVKRK